jgi:cytoskeleton protein RodZ
MSNETNHPAASQVVHIGDHLRARREEAKLSIEKVSQKTKINLNILRALEANNFQALPSPAYIKGFVLSYARVVGLNPSDVITKLEYSYLTIMGKPFPALNHTRQMSANEVGEPATGETKQAISEAPADVLDQEKRAQERQRLIVPAVVFGGICIVFIGLYQLVTKTIDSETNSTVEKPYGPTFVPSSELVDINKSVEEKAAKVAATEAAKVVAAEAEKVAEEKAAQEKKSDDKKPEDVKPNTPGPEVRRNFPDKDFRKITVRLFSVLPDAPENQDSTILPPRIKDAWNKDLENVFVKATDGNTWMSYKVDQNPIESVILEKDKDIFLQGKEILMFLGNVRVTKIFYQNRLIDAPTKTGFKSLIFPESKSTKHMLPLFPKASDDILYTAEEYQRRMKLEEEELGIKKP